MATDAIAVVEASALKRDRGAFAPGDSVRVHVKVIEGEKERVQIFEGIIIRKRGEGARATFTVRRVSYGVGVERTFPLHSPRVERVQVVKSAHVRRSKLYYLRARTGKAARLREKRQERPAGRCGARRERRVAGATSSPASPAARRRAAWATPRVRQRRSGPLQTGLFELEEDLYAQERGAWARGLWVAGVDEVGRGPLAGPVVAAAVILDPTAPVDGLRDSKLLTRAATTAARARDPRPRARLRRGPRRAAADRHGERAAGHLVRHARGARAATSRARARPGRRQPPDPRRDLHPAGDRRRRSPLGLGGRRVDPREGRARLLHAARRPALSRVRLPAAQGVRDRRRTSPRSPGSARARFTGAPSTGWSTLGSGASPRLSTSSFGCSDVSPTALERPLVPRFLLAGFADATGQLIAERRDRTRRRLVLVDAAVAELGRYALADDRSDAPALARLLAEVEARGAEAVQRITAGTFPPAGAGSGEPSPSSSPRSCSSGGTTGPRPGGSRPSSARSSSRPSRRPRGKRKRPGWRRTNRRRPTSTRPRARVRRPTMLRTPASGPPAPPGRRT